MVPTSTRQNYRIFGFKLDCEDSIAVAGLVPQFSLQGMRGFLCFLVVDSHNAVSSCCCEVSSVRCVIEGKDLVVGLNPVPELLAGLGDELEEVAVGIGSQDDRPHGLQLLGGRSPAQGVDWGLEVAFLVLDVGVELHYLARFDEVVDSHESIAMSTGYQGILLGKLGEHHLALLLDGGLQPQLLLQLHFFDYSD